MTDPLDEVIYNAAIARVYRGNQVIGTAFLVADRYLLTCAHVVTLALSLSATPTEAPSQSLEVDFLCAEDPARFSVIVTFWKGRDARSGDDIAVLKLQNPPPSEANFLSFKSKANYAHRSFNILGFPEGLKDGGRVTGTFVGAVGQGRVQMKAETTGYVVEPGYSGSPVWDEQLGGIVGMTVARDALRQPAKVAFMLSSRQLQPALQTVVIESLLDLLGPEIATIQPTLLLAWRVLQHQWSTLKSPSVSLEPLAALHQTLVTLQQHPQGEAPFPPLLQFVAALTLSEAIPAALKPQLDQWLTHQCDDLSTLLAHAQQQVTAQQQQAQTAQQHLLIWVNAASGNYKGRCLVNALFISDYDQYDPYTGWGSQPLSAPQHFADADQGGTVDPEVLPDILNACLTESSNAALLRNLTLEVLLPSKLLHSPVDRWLLETTAPEDADLERDDDDDLLEDDDLLMPEPLGYSHRVVIRSVARLSSKYQTRRGRWQTSWEQLIQQHQNPAHQGLLCGDNCSAEQIRNQLIQNNTIIGLHLTQALQRFDKTSPFAAFHSAAAIAALWPRQDLDPSHCHDQFQQLLNCCLQDLQNTVKQKRIEASIADPNTHLGHHLTLVWEDPKLVPPTIDQPLEMPA